MLKQSVKDVFIKFTETFEGRIRHLYLDVKGLPTVGAGVYLPTADEAAKIQFRHQDGRPANPNDIRHQWHIINAQREVQANATRKMWASSFFNANSLVLDDATLDALTHKRLASTVNDLAKYGTLYLPAFANAPADAQLATLSVAWATGSGFMRSGKWPKFTKAFLAGDWAGCAKECALDENGNAGVAPRNKANKILFTQAAIAQAQLELVHWS